MVLHPRIQKAISRFSGFKKKKKKEHSKLGGKRGAEKEMEGKEIKKPRWMMDPDE